ncbi:tetratricopeptide (TPR) repeat protein [Thermostichus sp. MS-CIW-21]|jgi:tetratricopeptide (TPR) repeat protein|uniref:tetratricopeptide repeat protein n=1 Tax=unclassified Synechococcus TaxID=2626047 RepID=UPI000306B6C0|nr:MULTISPECIES: tetratricopeptide repeat protein [unclassified Synechococcus]PIK87356.1 hypothetical protein SYN63AY4M2_01860 [Synechococcus sp. 63AY4M2]PIK89732.1 hypothetical protein SYN65AY6A5_05595 [Synechococcus sp. 65AY6A5]PIK93297.1 hypothetical protein SYN65AY6LI_12785 [Synechococcus sp. 65AY6Li]PIK96370.1 hypothetical protein SYN60AY4M2_02310 [Synechococcus sp. 60AY4M2]PIK99214.1 hypothetical protein SYN63AY4M1_13255 [Synechococcus sp. 63AY4M1]
MAKGFGKPAKKQPLLSARQAAGRFRRGEWAGCRQLCEQILAAADRSDLEEAIALTQAHALLGRIEEGSGRYPAAMLHYQQAIVACPPAAPASLAAEVHALLGGVLRQMGEKKQAQRLFEQALARDPALLMARVGLADLLQMRGEYEAALAHYLQAWQGSQQEADIP